MGNLPAIIDDTDMTETEIKKVKEYVEQGLPGITSIKDNDLYRMYDLYLGGSSYTQIAETLKIKKVMILYLSQHNKWYESKKEHLNELLEKTKTRVQETKLRSSEFMLLTVQAYQRRIANKLKRYLATNDESEMDTVSLKELTQLMKAIEMINELDQAGKDGKGKTPAIGLNLGQGVTVERDGDNRVVITPKDTNIGDTLRQYAEAKREEKKKIENVKHDIDTLEGDDDV